MAAGNQATSRMIITQKHEQDHFHFSGLPSVGIIRRRNSSMDLDRNIIAVIGWLVRVVYAQSLLFTDHNHLFLSVLHRMFE